MFKGRILVRQTQTERPYAEVERPCSPFCSLSSGPSGARFGMTAASSSLAVCLAVFRSWSFDSRRMSLSDQFI